MTPNEETPDPPRFDDGLDNERYEPSWKKPEWKGRLEAGPEPDAPRTSHRFDLIDVAVGLLAGSGLWLFFWLKFSEVWANNSYGSADRQAKMIVCAAFGLFCCGLSYVVRRYSPKY